LILGSGRVFSIWRGAMILLKFTLPVSLSRNESCLNQILADYSILTKIDFFFLTNPVKINRQLA